VIMATHDLDLVRRSNYRTIELNHGRLVFDSADTPVSAASGALSFDSIDTPHESRESV
jgi:ABC-type phosphate/phosphonate transport system ATPase subunit